MQCTRCGTTAEDEQRFCGHCGNPLGLVCTNCGAENPGAHLFCSSCGTELAPVPATASAPTVCERRVVSVLFVDLVEFTSFSEHRDVEDVRALIGEYFDLAREVIDHFGGTVDKFIGDAVMAWWGATTSREDDAERAVRAGLEVVDRVSSLGERAGIEGLTARAGVMTGEASVGPGGNEMGLLLGDLVNSTSRLQSIAAPGTVYVGDVTAGLIASSIGVVRVGEHRVKGKEEALTAWRVERVLSERGGLGRPDILEPPFVGRTAELRLLKDALHATGREERARLVSLVGQAGIGKSRLIWELKKYVDGLAENVYWHEGRSPSYGDGLAMWALGEMIRGRAGIAETEPASVTSSRLSECLTTYIHDTERRTWVEDRLAALLGVGGSVGSERTELFSAARALFEAIAEHGTTVLVFENLHWADPSLLQFIEELPDWSHNHPILVVTLARSDLLDRRPDWGSGRRGFASVHLTPLADDEMGVLIRGMVPGIPDPAVDRIAASAGGVPLFAVEMVRMLIADHRLVLGDGAASIVGELDELEVPDSIQAVTAARLDRLPAEERDLVRAAAVLGHTFTLEGLAALRRESIDKVERRLGDLIRKEILEIVRDSRSPEHGQYQWVQSILRDVAYGRIARTDRHELHLRVARYFRDLDEPELAPIAASHFAEALEYAPADDPALQADLTTSLQLAIDRAQALHAHEQVLNLVEIALPVVPIEVELDIRAAALEAAARSSDVSATDRHIGALLDLAGAGSNGSVVHRVVALAGKAFIDTHRSDRAVDLLEPHLERHPDLSSDPNLTRAAVYLARARMLSGDEEGAAVLADSVLEAAERLDLVEGIADAMITRATALTHRRPRQSMALLRGAITLCREHDLATTRLRGLINLGVTSPDFNERCTASEEAYQEAKRVGDRNRAAFNRGNLVTQSLHRLDLEQMEALLDDPVVSTSDFDVANYLEEEAQLLALRGDLAAAEERLGRAQELAAGLTDLQLTMGLELTSATIESYRGHHRALFEVASRHCRTMGPMGGLVWYALIGAAMEGDEPMVAEVLEMGRALPPSLFATPSVSWAEAMLILLRGDADGAVASSDGLVESLSSSGLRLIEFLVLLSMARHLPPDHDARDRYATRARHLAQSAEAQGLTDWIDRELGDAPLPE